MAYDGTSKLGECQECHCMTGGGKYCFEHAPYMVQPKADGSFIVDRNGRKHVFFDEPPIHPSLERLRAFIAHLWDECHDGGNFADTDWSAKFDRLISEDHDMMIGQIGGPDNSAVENGDGSVTLTLTMPKDRLPVRTPDSKDE